MSASLKLPTHTMRITRKRIVRHKVKKKKRITHIGGMLLKLPYYQYIRLDTGITQFESVMCGIASIDNDTDILSVCGLDTQHRVWFGSQKMNDKFYETYMNKCGYEHTNASFYRKHVLEAIAQPDTIIRNITETTITLTLSHLKLNIYSDYVLNWTPIYTGKELYNMITAQISPSSSPKTKSLTIVPSSKNTNTLRKMVFPKRRKPPSKRKR